ncbi:H2AFY [Cordylochernes scorpioides]|uniref:Histone H2A n=1 Tax=Cordylochernes scorpioides TaxID=51811 RepID=A0ABY6KDV2_9ARAC|nr:H2AFY [Cordylochernes scorpioides]
MAPRSRRISRSSRAGLTFSVSRIDRRHRQLLHHVRMGSQSPVYLSGVIEYLALEILELAGNYAKDNHKKRITPRHLLFAIGMDQELRQIYITKGTVNKDIYIGECLKKRLLFLPFIRKHDVPDPAPAHYSCDTLKFLDDEISK